MLISNIVAYLVLQFMYMGMWRPKSEEGQMVKLGKENEHVTKNIIKQKIEALGKMSFHEIMTTILFIFAIILFVFRYFDFMPGWSMMFPKPKFIKDATSGLIACILYFVIPAKPEFHHVFDDDEKTRPIKSSPGILTWKVVEDKMPWGTVLLLGSGFGLAEGMRCSRLSILLGKMLKNVVAGLPNMVVLFIVMTMASFITELTSNVAVANIILPIIAELSINLNVHPVMLMLPVCIMCSHSFMLPVGTPPNALVAPACNMPTWSMIKAGFFVKMFSLVIWWGFWPIVGTYVFDAASPPPWLADVGQGNITEVSCIK
ncbi:protein I'm not dead yet-like [Agrilus planipennis]|uniref:Protein I'm not dead yet-like n=1 Tax=Agrilus planipennis TaxID=224129 RepID=A0A7F5R5F6_AGRPL|nr:protein I'm not dead yet-like [Agrilus planipennis]